jgi:hypothetical protein
MQDSSSIQEPLRDENSAHPAATAWRPTLKEIIRAFASGDFALERGVPAVAPVTSEVAQQISNYVKEYGETLVELPEDSWDASISQWMQSHSEVLVDPWTEESGRSDLVLSARVYEREGGFVFEIDSVHVP